jgi:pyrroline-5-carboxylate reductase
MEESRQLRIAFIGAGQMATALAEGLLRAGVITASQITAADPDPEARSRFARATKATVYAQNSDAISGTDVVILAVKPRLVPEVLRELASGLADKLVISLAAGVSTGSILQVLGPAARVVRVMPNTAVRILQGTSVFVPAGATSEEDVAIVRRLFGAVGVCIALEEGFLDAVTAVSGSGPALVYLLVEAMIDAGVLVGLPRSTARTLVLQTFRGTVEMLRETGGHPAELAAQVTSPGGTTIAALKVLEERGVRGALMAAVEAAARRAAELRSRDS